MGSGGGGVVLMESVVLAMDVDCVNEVDRGCRGRSITCAYFATGRNLKEDGLGRGGVRREFGQDTATVWGYKRQNACRRLEEQTWVAVCNERSLMSDHGRIT